MNHERNIFTEENIVLFWKFISAAIFHVFQWAILDRIQNYKIFITIIN